MRLVAPVEYERISKICDLFSDNARSFQLEDGVALPHAPPLLLQRLATTHIADKHNIKASSMPVLLSAIPNATVAHRSTVGTEDKVFLLGDPVPTYIDNYLRDGKAPADTLYAPGKLRLMSGISVLATHWNSTIYGHWLMEGLPKLLLLRKLLTKLPPFRIIAPSSCGQSVKSWSNLLLPDVDVEIFDSDAESLKCESLLLPSWFGGVGHRYHPLLNSLIQDVVRDHDIKNEGRRIYVSREIENPHRALSNKDEIEDIAVGEGFEVITPERIPILEQLRIFGSADRIVGPFGSAMHNSLFSPSGARVLCLNWINDLQSRIAHLRNQYVGYIVPAKGTVAYDRNNPVSRSFEIQGDTFKGALRAFSQSSTEFSERRP